MNIKRLYEILTETTVQLRKGPVVTQEKIKDTNIEVMEVFLMPDESEAPPSMEKVDVEFLVIGVDKTKAEKNRADLISILNDYPEPERLAGGPSYIEIGGIIGDQGAAFQLFALGSVLGLWKVITPKSLGMTGNAAREMAGSGFIMISGYSPTQEPSS